MTPKSKIWRYTNRKMNNPTIKHWKEWLILLLVVLNITTIVTAFAHCKCDATRGAAVVTENGSDPICGKCFMNHMQFDKAQCQAFQTIDSSFCAHIHDIITCLDSEKKSMFYELGQDEPDTARLHLTAHRIGSLHGDLKEETVRFYIATKAICRPEQQKTLNRRFIPLFQTPCCTQIDSCCAGECHHRHQHQENEAFN